MPGGFSRVECKVSWLVRKDEPTKKGKRPYAVDEQNEAFKISGSARRFEQLPSWVESVKDAIIEGEKLRAKWQTKPDELAKPKSLISVEEVAKAYVAENWQNWKPRTRSDVLFRLYGERKDGEPSEGKQKIVPWFKENAPSASSLTKATISRYFEFLRDGEPTFRLFAYRKYCLALAAQAKAMGVFSDVPKIKLKGLDPDDEAGRALTSEEWAKLDQLSQNRPVLNLQIRLGRFEGMRKGEVLGLQRAWVDLGLRQINLPKRATKTANKRSFPIVPEVYPALKAHLEASESALVFPSPKDSGRPVTDNKSAWQTLKEEAGVECRFHDLRATFITDRVNDGWDSMLVSKWVGASPEVIYERYYKAKVSDLWAAYEKAREQRALSGNKTGIEGLA